MALLTTGSANFSAELRTYYEMRLLFTARPELVYNEGATPYTITDHMGKTIQWRRWPLLAAATTPLTEGVTPVGSNPTVVQVLDQVLQYGDYVLFSDVVNITSIDMVMRQIVELQGQQSGNTLDIVGRDEFVAGTQVYYANGKTARNQLTTTDTIDGRDLVYIRVLLQNQNARPFGDGYFHAVISPATEGDLTQVVEYQNISQYQDKEMIFRALVVNLYNFKFYITTNAKVFYGAGVGGVDVQCSLFFGKDALGKTDIESLGMQNFYKPLGSSGTADPINQRQSNGWKTSYAATILNDNFLVRYESVSTFPSPPAT